MPAPKPRACTGATCDAMILDVQCKKLDGSTSRMVLDQEPIPRSEHTGRGEFIFTEDDTVEHIRRGEPEKTPRFRSHLATCPDPIPIQYDLLKRR